MCQLVSPALTWSYGNVYPFPTWPHPHLSHNSSWDPQAEMIHILTISLRVSPVKIFSVIMVRNNWTGFSRKELSHLSYCQFELGILIFYKMSFGRIPLKIFKEFASHFSYRNRFYASNHVGCDWKLELFLPDRNWEKSTGVTRIKFSGSKSKALLLVVFILFALNGQ